MPVWSQLAPGPNPRIEAGCPLETHSLSIFLFNEAIPRSEEPCSHGSPLTFNHEGRPVLRCPTSLLPHRHLGCAERCCWSHSFGTEHVIIKALHQFGGRLVINTP